VLEVIGVSEVGKSALPHSVTSNTRMGASRVRKFG
jgi:hypothetical protein